MLKHASSFRQIQANCYVHHKTLTMSFFSQAAVEGLLKDNQNTPVIRNKYSQIIFVGISHKVTIM